MIKEYGFMSQKTKQRINVTKNAVQITLLKLISLSTADVENIRITAAAKEMNDKKASTETMNNLVKQALRVSLSSGNKVQSIELMKKHLKIFSSVLFFFI